MLLPKIKTKKQTQIILKNLFDLVKELNKKKIHYFIDSGTLLGMYRDKKLIEWDWDVELSLTEKEFELKKKKILKIIKFLRFKIIKIDKINKKIDIKKSLNERISKFSFKVWKLSSDNKYYIRNNFKIPIIYFKKKNKIKCYNRKFNAPYKVREYLEYMYGDWKTPLRTFRKEDYLSKSYYRKNIFKKIYNFLKKFKPPRF